MVQDDTIFAFVLMPFDSEFDDVYKLGIKEAASNLGIRAERVDEQLYHEGILDRIYKMFAFFEYFFKSLILQAL